MPRSFSLYRMMNHAQDPVTSRGLGLTDGRMSARARFRLKYPSLLRFEPDARDENRIRSTLRKLYGVVRAPSESALRERLDPVDPRSVRCAFKQVVAAGQRGRVWRASPGWATACCR